jgi:hypothetical protein
MFYWVCVNDMPVALPTSDVEAAKKLALDHIDADASARVYIDVHARGASMTKLRYDQESGGWIRTDVLAP